MLLIVIVYDATLIHCIYIICLGGDRGWTPFIIKLAGVSRMKVPKSSAYMGAGSRGRNFRKITILKCLNNSCINCKSLSCTLILDCLDNNDLSHELTRNILDQYKLNRWNWN